MLTVLQVAVHDVFKFKHKDQIGELQYSIKVYSGSCALAFNQDYRFRKENMQTIKEYRYEQSKNCF